MTVLSASECRSLSCRRSSFMSDMPNTWILLIMSVSRPSATTCALWLVSER